MRKFSPQIYKKKEEIKEKDNVIELDPIKEQAELDILEEVQMNHQPLVMQKDTFHNNKKLMRRFLNNLK